MTENQLNNIHKLPKDDLIIILNECIESLGCVSVQEYSQIMDMPKRTVYLKMKQGKIKFIKLSEHLFPIIN